MIRTFVIFFLIAFSYSTFASDITTTSGVSAEKALGWLKNGNTRFLKPSLRKDGQTQADIKRLSHGQNPHSIVLSCSDSRVPPEVVFDQKLGEIFTVRTAGEALDPNVIGSIEYAVAHLGSKLVVVMGHSECGAVKEALKTLDGTPSETESLNHLVKDLHPRLAEFKGKQFSEHVHVESKANTNGVAKDLIARSSLIKKKFDSGEIEIVTAHYDLHTGQVQFFNFEKRSLASDKKNTEK